MNLKLSFCLWATIIHFVCSVSTDCTTPHLKEGQLIRNKKSRLVLDGSKEVISLEHVVNNNSQQLWTFESNQDGSFYIINKGTKLVLEKANEFIFY